MKKTVRIMTLCLAAAALGWGLLCLPRQAAAPASPADGGTALPVPEAEPFSLLLVLTDGGVPRGALQLTFSADRAVLTGLPADTRLADGGRFAPLYTLCTPQCAKEALSALSRVLPDPPAEEWLILSYEAAARLMQSRASSVTLTLGEDVPVPFIGGRLILPAGRCTLTPQQVVAYWRQAEDPVTAVSRQGEVIALLLTRWFSGERREQGETLFAELVNAGETNWRIDRYARQKRTLAALCRSGGTVRYALADGETVGQGADRRFEFHESSARKGAFAYE